MNLLALPNDLLYYITKFLSISDKMTMRETNKELKNNVKVYGYSYWKDGC